MGVPVYSIGPTSISRITSGSRYTTGDAFEELGRGRYTSSTPEGRRSTNPFYYADRVEWLKAPTIETAWGEIIK
jgi:hypothetical protein